VLVIDGAREVVAAGAKFPHRDPVLRLVAVRRDEIELGVVGGAFESGETLTLGLGEDVTLEHAAERTRYELELAATR
jgi:hypothetical protein